MIPANKDKMHIPQAFPSLFLKSRQTLGYFLTGDNLVIAVVDRTPTLWKTEHVTVVGVKIPQHVSLGGHLPAVS